MLIEYWMAFIGGLLVIILASFAQSYVDPEFSNHLMIISFMGGCFGGFGFIQLHAHYKKNVK